MARTDLGEFGRPKIPYDKIIIGILILIFIFVFYNLKDTKFDFDISIGGILGKYNLIANSSVEGIGESEAVKYVYEKDNCTIYYTHYLFEDRLSAGKAVYSKELGGMGFLETRVYNVLEFVDYSRYEKYYRNYDNHLNKENPWYKLIFLETNAIYDIESNCEFDYKKLAKELLNN